MAQKSLSNRPSQSVEDAKKLIRRAAGDICGAISQLSWAVRHMHDWSGTETCVSLWQAEKRMEDVLEQLKDATKAVERTLCAARRERLDAVAHFCVERHPTTGKLHIIGCPHMLLDNLELLLNLGVSQDLIKKHAAVHDITLPKDMWDAVFTFMKGDWRSIQNSDAPIGPAHRAKPPEDTPRYIEITPPPSTSV